MNLSYLRQFCLCLCLASLLIPVAADSERPAAPELTLRDAIVAALEHNPELQAFAFRMTAQDARARQAALRPAPAVTIDIENFAGTGGASGFSTAETTLALSQIIELGGKRDARINAALAGGSVIEIERQARQLDVLAEVTRRFITLAQREQQLQLAGTATSLAEKTVAASVRRVKAAKSPHAELDRAQIALDRARLGERGAAVEVDSARKQLAALWGETEPLLDGQPFGAARADLFTMPPLIEFTELAERLAANPELFRFVSESRLRDAELRLASSLRHPDITLGAGIRRLEATNDQALVAFISMPLYSGRRAESFVAEAQANRDLVDAEWRATEIRLGATLYDLHLQLGRAVLEANTLHTTIQPRSEEALKETEYAYERGRYSYIELVDAQREFLSLQENAIEAAAIAHILRAEIERLTNTPLTEAVP